MPDCKIEIGVVEMSADDATPDNPGAMRSRIESAIRDAGFTDENRKYHVWFDGDNDGGACGVAPVYPFDYPGPANPNNLGTSARGLPGPGGRHLPLRLSHPRRRQPGARLLRQGRHGGHHRDP